MHFELDTSDMHHSMQNAFRQLLNRTNALCQVTGAMGAEFKFICVQNLGEDGIDRPSEWSDLSSKYAKRVGREYATLDLTGNLLRSIRMETFDDHSTVYVNMDDCPYAARHQFGDEKMPKRPFFPIDENGEITPYARQRVIDAAHEALDRSLNGTPGPIY
jgi:phage gpG-like protein